VSGTDQWWPCFPTKSPGNLSPSVLAFLLYVEISQWLGSRGAKLKVGCWVSKIKGGLNGAGHLTLSDGVGLKAWKLYLIGGVTALLLPRKKREIVNLFILRLVNPTPIDGMR
jgi:hypothetical protein